MSLLLVEGFETVDFTYLASKWGAPNQTENLFRDAKGTSPTTVGNWYNTKGITGTVRENESVQLVPGRLGGKALKLLNPSVTATRHGKTFFATDLRMFTNSAKKIFFGHAFKSDMYQNTYSYVLMYRFNQTAAIGYNTAATNAADFTIEMECAVSPSRFLITPMISVSGYPAYETKTLYVQDAGKWDYFEFGVSFEGGAARNGWLEIRSTIHSVRWDNIYPGAAVASGWSEDHFMLTAARVAPTSAFLGGPYTIDDIYVCNGEGEINNTFLGPCSVRPMVPIGNDTLMEFAVYEELPSVPAQPEWQILNKENLPISTTYFAEDREDTTLVKQITGNEAGLQSNIHGTRALFHYSNVQVTAGSDASAPIIGVQQLVLMRPEYIDERVGLRYVVRFAGDLYYYTIQGEDPYNTQSYPLTGPYASTWIAFTRMHERNPLNGIWQSSQIDTTTFGVQLQRAD